MVDVGGRRIHLHCSGGGSRRFVLEAGALGTTEIWRWLQDALDDDARVCSYDRAGLGASDVNPDGFDPANVARDMKAALNAAGERGPFVLVGHSLGGIFVRDFAAAFPGDVQALVLVDPSHEDQLAGIPQDLADKFELFRSMVKVLSKAAHTGVLRAWNPVTSLLAGIDDPARARARLYAQDPKHLAAASAELQAWPAIMARVRAAPLAETVPLLVVSAGVSPGAGQPDITAFTLPLHRALADRSQAGSHEVIAGANHFTILTDRATAGRLAAHIRDFLSGTGSAPPPRR
jgi:pimeloyl-ACP methyl ester carboxylesterase